MSDTTWPPWRELREAQGVDPGAVSSLCTDGENGADDPAWHADCPGCGCWCHLAAPVVPPLGEGDEELREDADSTEQHGENPTGRQP